MDGHVILLNSQSKFAALRVNNGDYVVIEVLDEKMELASGDFLSGNFRTLGHTKVVNLTARKLMTVSVRDVGCKVAHRTKRIVLDGKMAVNDG